MWLNFHTHSNYCDGKSSVQEIVEKARSLKVGVLGFSSHAPLPFECAWCMRKENYSNYIKEIATTKQYNSDLNIYAGLEVDYIPRVTGPDNFSKELDYTIGSIHFVEKFNGGQRWEIDGPHQSFLEGLEAIFRNNFKDAAVRYFEITREMVENETPSVVGHLDKIKIQNIGDKFFSEDESWYREQIDKTLHSIQAAECVIEVNTRGLYKKKSKTTYPSPWILERILEKEIPITLSSDAHHVNDLVSYFPETAMELRKIGFREIHILQEGQWRPFKFSEHGIE
jgi:histidinol-phosphatase (PHP family)